MTKTKLLIGSLSSDLYRVANLVGRDSYPAANRFFQEAQKWSSQLSKVKVKRHIKKIILDINADSGDIDSVAKAERLLMYSVLLQNYSLRLK